jgi:hypothetical protein
MSELFTSAVEMNIMSSNWVPMFRRNILLLFSRYTGNTARLRGVNPEDHNMYQNKFVAYDFYFIISCSLGYKTICYLRLWFGPPFIGYQHANKNVSTV